MNVHKSLMGSQTSALIPPELRKLDEDWQDPVNFPSRFGRSADYARVLHKRPLSYFAARIHNIGFEGKRIADLGCGTGTWSLGMRAGFPEVYSLDYAAERIELARHLTATYQLSGMHWTSGDIHKLPYENDFFDAVFSTGVFCESGVALDALNEVFRILKPGGRANVAFSGMGYAYLRLAKKDDQSIRGQRGLMFNWLNNRLKELPALLKTKKDLAAHLRSSYFGSSAIDKADGARVFSYLDEWGYRLGPDLGMTLLGAVADYREFCTEQQVRQLGSDLDRIAHGQQDRFTVTSSAIRLYDVPFIEEYCRGIGFEDLSWNYEGCLWRAENPVPVRPIYPPTHYGEPVVWEIWARKPLAG